KMTTKYHSSGRGWLIVVTKTIILLYIAFNSGEQSMAGTVSLTWDLGSIPNLAGYRLYSGTTPGTFTQRIEAGNSTTISVSNLKEGQTYFFAVTAYNTSGAESPPSNEVSYTVPLPVTAAAPVQASAPATTAMAAPATTPGPTPRT